MIAGRGGVSAVATDKVARMIATAGGVGFEIGLPGQGPRETTIVNVLVMTAFSTAVALLLSLFPRVAVKATARPGSGRV